MAIGDKLFVADKPTLDVVKNNTDNIQISSGTYGYASANLAQTFTSILNIVGEGKLLKANFYFDGSGDSSIPTLNLRITIDGIQMEAPFKGSTAIYPIVTWVGNSTVKGFKDFIDIPFKTSLLIEARVVETGKNINASLEYILI